jgi:hypothetical protein
MAMHMLPAFFTTTVDRKQKSSKSQKLAKSRAEHEAWVASMTKGKSSDKRILQDLKRKEYIESMRVDRSDYVSAGMSGSVDACVDRSLMNRLHTESKQVRAEILYKASRVMPLYNKGGLQYATPEEDMTKVGTKSRR